MKTYNRVILHAGPSLSGVNALDCAFNGSVGLVSHFIKPIYKDEEPYLCGELSLHCTDPESLRALAHVLTLAANVLENEGSKEPSKEMQLDD